MDIFKFDRYSDKSIHIWIAWFGVHIFWPDIWHSRFDFSKEL